nr:DUF2085 domain-containing protein [Neobacillus sp. Marseille-Q6967]
MLDEFLHFFGRAICHQIEERSLTISGETLSVCARDTGIYVGIFSTLSYLIMSKRKKSITIPSIRMSFFLLLFILPLIIDGLGSYLHLFESNNLRRLVTGILFGLVLPYFLYPVLSNKLLKQKSETVIQRGRDLYFPLLLSCILGIMSYWGIIPYYFLNGMIIFTTIVWFSLCASFLFSGIRLKALRTGLSVLICLTFLSSLSLLHMWLFPTV